MSHNQLIDSLIHSLHFLMITKCYSVAHIKMIDIFKIICIKIILILLKLSFIKIIKVC